MTGDSSGEGIVAAIVIADQLGQCMRRGKSLSELCEEGRTFELVRRRGCADGKVVAGGRRSRVGGKEILFCGCSRSFSPTIGVIIAFVIFESRRTIVDNTLCFPIVKAADGTNAHDVAR
jgi:hypothetical protein